MRSARRARGSSNRPGHRVMNVANGNCAWMRLERRMLGRTQRVNGRRGDEVIGYYGGELLLVGGESMAVMRLEEAHWDLEAQAATSGSPSMLGRSVVYVSNGKCEDGEGSRGEEIPWGGAGCRQSGWGGWA